MLAGRGYALALVGRRREVLEETADGARTPAVILEADLSSPDAAAGVVDRASDRLGRVDVLVNNAAIAPLRPIDRASPAELSAIFALNAVSPAAMIARAWPIFVRQASSGGPGGCIVNVSTIGTIDPFPGFFAYAASKAPLNLMAASCAREGAAQRIRAFSIAPGAVETPMLRAIFDRSAIPPERCLSPDDVARVIVSCIVGERDDENGRTIVVPSP